MSLVRLVKEKECQESGHKAADRGLPFLVRIMDQSVRPVIRACYARVVTLPTNLFVHLHDSHPDLHREALKARPSCSKENL